MRILLCWFCGISGIILAANTPPTISAMANQTALIGISVGPLPFTVGDAETAAGSLTVSVTSSNVTLVPNGNIILYNGGVDRTVTMTPAAGQTGTTKITLSVSDGGGGSTTNSFLVTVGLPGPGTAIFSNAAAITIPASGSATAYPATINVSGMTGATTNLSVTLKNMSHGNFGDVDMLLVGPLGQQVVLCSAAANGQAMSNVSFTLADGAAFGLPFSSALPAGTYRPTDFAAPHTTPPHIFPAPAPAAPHAATLSAFNGLSPNGTWSLYVFDSAATNNGVISNGWSLVIAASGSNLPPTISDIANQTILVSTNTGPIAFTVSDPDTALNLLTLSKGSSNVGLVPTNNIVLGGSLSNRTVTVTPAAGQTGVATITVSVSDGTNSASDSFVLTVNAANTPPTISAMANQTALIGISVGPLPFTVGDAETAAGSLTVSVTSSNVTLVPNGNIILYNGGVDRTVTMTPAAGQTGTTKITLSVSDGGGGSTTNSFLVTVGLPGPGTAIFSNAAAITIPASGSATAYPATINVSGMTGATTNLSVTLKNMSHGNFGDVDMLLVGPLGQQVVLCSAAANGQAMSNVSFTLADGAAFGLPFSSALPAGTYQPTDFAAPHTAPPHIFPAPAPAAPHAATLSAFNGLSPNGTWSLYVFDSAATNNGVISNGWSLVIAASGSNLPPTISDIANQTILVSTNTGSIAFTVSDPDTALNLLTLSKGSSNVGLVPTNNIVLGGSLSNRTVTVTPAAGQTGVATITVSVSDGTNSASDSFVLTVNAANTPPTISAMANQTALIGISVGPLPFTVGDAETAAGSLTVSVTSSNVTLVPNGNIILYNGGVDRTVTMTPAAGQTGTTKITLSVSDGGGGSTTNSFLVTVGLPGPGTAIFSNAAAITIPASGSATAYPATINVSGMTGATTNLSVTLKNMSHGNFGDVDMLLVGPLGQQVVLCSAAANGQAMSNVSFTLADGAAFGLPFSSALPAGTYRPTDFAAPHTTPPHIFPAPAPAAPHAATLSAFNGLSPNGTWSLYVFDSAATNNGVISNGWSLVIAATGSNLPPTISDIANQTILVSTNTGPIAFTVSDPDTALNLLTLSKGSSNVGLVPTNNIVLGGSLSNRTVTVTPAAGQTGVATITVSVSDGTNSASDSFVLTVNAANTPPTISAMANQTALIGISVGPLPFTVGDAETAAGSLTVSVTSSNVTLVPNGNIILYNGGVDRTVTMTPAAGQTGTTKITLSVSDGGGGSTTNSFLVTVGLPGPGTAIFSNAAAITIPASGSATAYPATINVSGMTGATTNLSVTLKNMSHGNFGDVDMLLVGPLGQQVVLCSAAANGQAMSNVSFTLADGAAFGLPFSSALPAGTYRPTDFAAPHTTPPHIFPAPAPAAPHAATLSAFNGLSPNGTWSLYVFDSAATNNGVISNGWSLVIAATGSNLPPTISDIANQTILVSTNTGSIAFTVSDPDTALNLLTLSKGSSNVGLVPTNNIVLGGSLSNRTVTVTPAAGQTGVATITVSVSDGTNSASDSFVLTVNAANTPPTISAMANQTALVGRSVGPFNFTVGDVDTPAGNLTVSGSSSNQGLVPTTNIVFFNIDGVTRTVTVTPVDGQVGSSTITVSVSDGVNQTSTNFTFTVSAPPAGTAIFNNGNAITIPNRAVASAYPSTLNVAGLTGVITNLTLTLKGLNHTSSRDMEMMLVSPTGQKAVLFAHVGGGAVSNVTVTLDDAATYALPPSPFAILAGTYKPLDAGHDAFPLPAPVGPYGTTLAAFNGISPNGNWTLYVFDDLTGSGSGSISGGWSLAIQTGPPGAAPTISAIANQTALVGRSVGPFNFTVGDVDTPAGNLTVNGSSSNQGLVPTTNIVFFNIDGVTRTLTVTPVDGQFGSSTITVSVSDGVNQTSTNFTFTVSAPSVGTAIFNNGNAITIPNRAVASAYPSTLNVAGLTGAITKLTLTLKGLNHTSSRDMEMMLVSPTGQKAVLFAHVGGGTVSNVTVTLDDAAAYPLPPSPAAILAGTYRPLDAGHDAFPLPAPAGPYGTTLATFNGATANGNWLLYVFNDPAGSGSGSISGGWSLAITTGTTPPTISAIANQTALVGRSAGPFNFTVGDAETAAGSLTVSGSSSNLGLVPNGNIVFFNIDGVTRTLTVTPVDGQVGSATITVSVSDGENVTSTNFTFTVSAPPAGTVIFNNGNAITIPNRAVASAYPSTLNVAGLTGAITNLTLTLKGLNHTSSRDMEMMLVSPTGQKAVLFAHVGGGAVSNVTVTLDDAATYALPPSPAAILAGTYKPLDAGHDAFPAPAPVGPYGTTMAAFNGISPNGNWSLYVFDDLAGSGSGSISGGWSLAITTGTSSSTPPLVRIVGLTVSTNLVLRSTGTNGWSVFPEYKTNLSATNWFALTVQTNRYANGTNETFCGKPQGNRIYIRIRSLPD